MPTERVTNRRSQHTQGHMMTSINHTDYVEISRLMSKHVREMRAFRIKHGGRVQSLINAEDDYRNGGPIEHFRAAIETACREQPELEPLISRLFAWVKWNEGEAA